MQIAWEAPGSLQHGNRGRHILTPPKPGVTHCHLVPVSDRGLSVAGAAAQVGGGNVLAKLFGGDLVAQPPQYFRQREVA